MEPLDIHDPLADLFSAMCDGRLSDEQRAELAERMAEDPDAQLTYLKYCRMHADLRLRARSSRAVAAFRLAMAAEESATASPDAKHAGKPALRNMWGIAERPRVASWLVAAAVIGLLLTAMAFVAPPFYRKMTGADDGPSLEPTRTVARLTGLHDPVWAENQLGARLNSYLPTGHRLQLVDGLAEVTYDNGVKVILKGPCEYRIDSIGSGTLKTGQLAANVPSGAKGFAVDTPVATVTDLGTEFGIELFKDKQAHVVVFSGEVRVEVGPAGKSDRPRRKVRLTAGGLAAISSSGGLEITAAGADAAQIVQQFEWRNSRKDWRHASDESRPLIANGEGNRFSGPRTAGHEINLNDRREWSSPTGAHPANVPGRVGDGDRWVIVNEASIGNFKTFAGSQLELGDAGFLIVNEMANVSGDFKLAGGRLRINGNQGGGELTIGGKLEISGNSKIAMGSGARSYRILARSIQGTGNLHVDGNSGRTLAFGASTNFAEFSGTMTTVGANLGFEGDAAAPLHLRLAAGDQLLIGYALTGKDSALGDVQHAVLEVASLSFGGKAVPPGEYTWKDLAQLNLADIDAGARFGMPIYFNRQLNSGNGPGIASAAQIVAGEAAMKDITWNISAISADRVALRIGQIQAQPP